MSLGVARAFIKALSHLASTHKGRYARASDAEEILRTMCDGNVLNKVRHFVIHKDVTWQVDVYDDILKGIVLAEIELTQPDQALQIPDWVGAEVTADPRYRKINMVANRMAIPKIDLAVLSL
jgi:CYTH domain-containing protein